MKMRGSVYYSVIQDTMDYCGMGEYLHKHRCMKFEEAKKYLEEHPKCTHIDYFDGEEWHHNVTEDMSAKK
jgi:hypothetical protein